ncbi:acetyl-CoA carboxylase carboxyltransferase subunit alpha [candidate division KSB1 bacterium]|nr:acetyl-CoA carboxylase carboxyltransferase subunit alpha [candidate division KSB1 bacterium]
MNRILDFEKPIVELEKKISEMKAYAVAENVELTEDIKRLETKLDKLIEDTYAKLTRWERVLLSRHPDRPYTLDYFDRIFTDYVELHGDRLFSDDLAMVGGIAKLDGRPVMVLGQQKGRTTKENLRRNFGMMNPEGYRRAMRLMKLAAKFNRPIIILIDTPGAYPGIGAEERGQGEAIARNLYDMTLLPVPILVIVIGEGASGGALGVGMGDRVLMMENAWYSVISPEGCAAILWRDATKAPLAAEELKLTAPDLLELGVIDEIIKEPRGGAHRNHDEAARIVKERIHFHLSQLRSFDGESLIDRRIKKYGKIGFFTE